MTLKIDLHTEGLSNSFTFIAGNDINNFLYGVLERKIFIFITKEDYANLPRETSTEIDKNSFEKLSEEKKITLFDILDKDVVYVKYNNDVEIKEILDLRKKFVDDETYGILSIEYKAFKY